MQQGALIGSFDLVGAPFLLQRNRELALDAGVG